MSCGDAVGWEMPSGQVGIPTTPERAPRYFLSLNGKETLSKPLVGDLHPHPGSVPTGMAMESSELPGILVEWHTGNGEPFLGLKQCGSTHGPSALPASTGLRDASFPGPVFAPSSMGSVCQPPKDCCFLLCRQHPSLEKPLQQDPWDRNSSQKWFSGKSCFSKPKYSLESEAGCSAFAPDCFSLCRAPVKPRWCLCSLVELVLEAADLQWEHPMLGRGLERWAGELGQIGTPGTVRNGCSAMQQWPEGPERGLCLSG